MVSFRLFLPRSNKVSQFGHGFGIRIHCFRDKVGITGLFLFQIYFVFDARVDEAIPHVDPGYPEDEVLAHLGRLARELDDALLEAGHSHGGTGSLLWPRGRCT